MNDVIVSGLVKGSFVDVNNDGILFNIATSTGRNKADPDVFTAVSYGNSASFIKQRAESGSRIVVQGRISSEKLNTDNFHTIITVTRILSISDSQNGMDFTHATVSGLMTCEDSRTTGGGTTLLPLRIKNTRVYKSRDGTVGEYTTYLNGTVWADRAESLIEEGRIPMEDVFGVVSGILKPNSYENKDGDTINKTDIWVNDIAFSGEAPEVEDTSEPDDDAAPGTYRAAEEAPPF